MFLWKEEKERLIEGMVYLEDTVQSLKAQISLLVVRIEQLEKRPVVKPTPRVKEAPYGFRSDGKPRSKPGRKKKRTED
jgi:hypothetical protein